MRQVLTMTLVASVLFLVDLYVFSGLKGVSDKAKFLHSKWFFKAYWVFSVCLVLGLIISIYVKIGIGVRAATLLVFFILMICKVCFLPFLIADDLARWIIKRKTRAQKQTNTGSPDTAEKHPQAIPRSEFLMKAGLLAGALPLAYIDVYMKKNIYDYRILHRNVYLPNLPKAFDGLILGQISDIHCGSLYNRKAVRGGIDMLMREKPDLIFFTGDLVNSKTNEIDSWQDIFGKIKAPLGVFSTLGNHDYGDYAKWASVAEKRKDHADMISTHKNLGWDLLLNENRRLKVDNEEIGILGIENWGTFGRFPKYGRMDLATKNTDDLPVKLLLSHDPSHWRTQVLAEYPQIDMMFSGHTHGMQFGVQTEHFQWSPIEYVYREWAGFYKQAQQQLYVNVGFGYLTLFGRVGILPEITIFTLKTGTEPAATKA